MNEICVDNRFEIIEKAKKHLLEATNIETEPPLNYCPECGANLKGGSEE